MLQEMADNMNEFKNFHPVVNMAYFVAVTGFSMFFMHPVCLAMSLVCAFACSVMMKGRKAVKSNLMYMVPVTVAMTLINPAFSHEGVTVIRYLPNGNPLTAESMVYGAAAAVMIVSVICWFSCYNEVMTSDKFIYLFGRVIPAMSLILSMTLRFVPRFREHLKTVADAQRCIGRDVSSGNIISRIRNGLLIMSVMVTWSLENAIDTADSMKSRGYGHPGRTAYSIYRFDKRDRMALVYIAALTVCVMAGYFSDAVYFRYFPSMKGTEISLWSIAVFAAYFALMIFPVVIELREVRKWNAIKSKI